jgi:hypothetical protein
LVKGEFMKIRPFALCLVTVTFAIGASRGYAQVSPPNPAAAVSLAAKLAALEARVTALETIDESDIVGTYKWSSLGIELNSGDAGVSGIPARVNSSTDNLVFTLNADHTAQVISASGLRCTLPVLTYGIAKCQPAENEDEPATLTWSFANGVLTLSADPPDPGETLEFAVPASGVIVHSDSSEYLPGNTWSTIILLVKQPE